MKVCDRGKVAAQSTISGWCEKFRFALQPDGTHAIYSENAGRKYYLQVCGGGQVGAEPSVGGWCGKFRFAHQHDGTRVAWPGSLGSETIFFPTLERHEIAHIEGGDIGISCFCVSIFVALFLFCVCAACVVSE